MDPDEEPRLLKKTLALAEESNTMVRKLYRAMRWERLFRFFYCVVIIAISLGAYYFVQPYIDQFRGVISGGGSASEGSGDQASSFLQFLKRMFGGGL